MRWPEKIFEGSGTYPSGEPLMDPETSTFPTNENRVLVNRVGVEQDYLLGCLRVLNRHSSDLSLNPKNWGHKWGPGVDTGVHTQVQH